MNFGKQLQILEIENKRDGVARVAVTLFTVGAFLCLALLALPKLPAGAQGKEEETTAVAEAGEGDGAADKKEEEEEKEPVAKGGETIASSVSTGQFGSVGVGTIGAAPGDDQSVVGASIVRGRGNSCIARIINNGKKSYSISFAVIGESRTGSTAFRRSYTATVKPEGSVERTVSGCNDDLNVRVVLNSAKPN